MRFLALILTVAIATTATAHEPQPTQVLPGQGEASVLGSDPAPITVQTPPQQITVHPRAPLVSVATPGAAVQVDPGCVQVQTPYVLYQHPVIAPPAYPYPHWHWRVRLAQRRALIRYYRWGYWPY